MDPIHDTSGHGTDVCPAVTSDIALVMNTAEAHSDIFTPECSRDALSDTCLSCSRSTNKEEDGS